MWVRVLVVVLLCVPVSAAADEPGFEVVCPNPVHDGDAGELVVVRVGTGNWSLRDGETVVDLPSSNESSIAVSPNPDVANETYERSVRHASFSLTNAGERLTLARNGVVVDSIRYAEPPEGECLHRTTTGYEWRPVGASDIPVRRAGPANVTAFVLPDAPNVALDAFASADHRIFLAGYTFTSPAVADTLIEARERGVTVEVLLEGEPVGGISTASARTLDRLEDAGVSVTVLAGPTRRYSLHHAKYAVVDDEAIVTTENWKPSGIGGHSSRGWGVVVHEPAMAEDLAALFEADSSGRGTTPWTDYRRGLTTRTEPPANGSFRVDFEPASLEADSVELLVAPDNAEPAVVSLLDTANDSIVVEQVAIGSRDTPFLAATVDAARRGVPVEVLLSGTWYVESENRALVEYLHGVADREDLPLKAKVVEPNGRFEKVHAKGVVVDDTVVLGSLNWNTHAARENREVAVALYGRDVARYYRAVFRADWGGGAWDVPVGVPTVALLIGVVAAIRIGKP